MTRSSQAVASRQKTALLVFRLGEALVRFRFSVEECLRSDQALDDRERPPTPTDYLEKSLGLIEEYLDDFRQSISNVDSSIVRAVLREAQKKSEQVGRILSWAPPNFVVSKNSARSFDWAQAARSGTFSEPDFYTAGLASSPRT